MAQLQWWCAAQGVPWSWRWQPYPGVWLFCLTLVAGWVGLRRSFGTEADGGARMASWLGGVAALWIALDWPVGALGAGYLASVHMVQYLLIALIAPPLLLIGLPRGVFDRLDSGWTRRPLGVISHPIVSMSTFVAVMAFTHWPPVVDGLMVSQLGSFALDLLWLTSGLVFWWPIAAPRPRRAWLHDGTRVGYLIAATLVNTGVFAYLTFADLPLYATFELAPPVGALGTRDDQLIAGMLMKIGGAPIIWTAITIIFFRAYAASDSLGSEERKRRSRAGSGAALLLLLVPLVAACGDGSPDAGAVDTAPESQPMATESAEAWTEIGDLRVRHSRMGQPALPDRAAAYMTLRNAGVTELRITGAELSGASASLHETRMEGGGMSMAALDTLVLLPGETVELAPGAIHLMLTGLQDRPTVGDTLRVRLLSAAGEGFDVAVPVVPLADVGG